MLLLQSVELTTCVFLLVKKPELCIQRSGYQCTQLRWQLRMWP